MDATKELIERIIAQGDDDLTRAQALGVSRRTITEYKAGKVPRIVRSLLDRGILVVGGQGAAGAIVGQREAA